MQYYSYSDSGNPELIIPEAFHERHYTKLADEEGKVCPRDYPINSIGSIPEHRIRAVKPSEGELRTQELVVKDEWKGTADKDSFSAIRKSGAIKMTPWSAGSILTRNRIVDLNPIVTDVAAGSEIRISDNTLMPNCRMNPLSEDRRWVNIKSVTRLKQMRTSIDYIRRDFGDIPHYPLVGDGDIDKLSMAAQASVVSELAGTVDLLTEIAEFSETATFVTGLIQSARKPTDTFLKQLARYSHRPGSAMSKDMAGAWMQYRYAIMPIYYSIKDAIELMAERRNTYKTARHNESVIYTPSLRDMSRAHLFDDGTRTYTIRAVGKKRYESVAGRLFDQIQFNPFKTAWEKVKLSWVIDWFINVGDWIDAQSAGFSSLYTEAKYCLSITEEILTHTYLYLPPMVSDAKSVFSFKGDGPYQAYKTEPPKPKSQNDAGGQFLLQTVTGRTYNRSLFQPLDIELQFNPNLNSSRVLDAVSLAVQNTSFRRFK